MRSLRIGIVIGSIQRGGCETHLLQVLPRLQAEGITPHVFVIGHEGPLSTPMREAGVRVTAPWIPTDLERRRSIVYRLGRLGVTALQFILFLRRERFDAVHFFLPASYWFGAPLALLAGPRTLLMSRRSLNHYLDGKPLRARLERLLHKRMSALLGNSRAVVRELIEQEEAPADKVHLLYNGVSAPSTPPTADSARARFGLPANALVLAVVANLIPYKGHADLFKALARINTRLPPSWRLLLAGRDDGYGETLRAHAASVGLEEHVLFLGEQEDVASVLAAADIFVLPSHEEGFSNALLEAMALGKAIVATRVGGNAEALEDGACGIITSPRDLGSLASAIERLAGSSEERHAFGAAARRTAMTRFTADRCVAAYAALYRQLCTETERVPTGSQEKG